MHLTPLTLKTHEVKTSAWGVPGKTLPFPARQPKPEGIEAFGSLGLGRLRPLRKTGRGDGPRGDPHNPVPNSLHAAHHFARR